MSQHIMIDVEVPADLAQFKLPRAVDARLQDLLDRQDRDQNLTANERKEAEGLVNLAELLSLIQLRAQRLVQPS